MRVVVFSQLPPPVHGSTVVTEQLVKLLRRRGDRVRVLDRRYSRNVSEVGTISLRKVGAFFSLLARAVRMLARRPQLLIFFATNRPASFVSDLAVCAIATVFRVKIVYYLHSVGFSALAGRNSVLRSVVRWFFKRSDRVVCLSESVADDVRAFVPKQEIAIVANAVPAHWLAEAKRDASKFVFLANLLPDKGASDVVEIARECKRIGSSAHFELYGHPADSEYFAGLIDSIAALDNIEYRGPIAGSLEKSKLLSGAVALLYPTRYALEAQPLAIIEALSAGTPTIAYAKGSIPELVRGTGVVCADRPAMLRHVLSWADSTDEQMERRREECLRRYEQLHSERAFRNAWDGILTTTVRG
ncbi:glycosyltransferase family 4 protein [Microbacterium sp. GXF7504]